MNVPYNPLANSVCKELRGRLTTAKRKTAYRAAARRRRLTFQVMEERRLLTADLAPTPLFNQQTNSIVVSKAPGGFVSNNFFTPTDTLFSDFTWGNFGDTSTNVAYQSRLTLNGVEVANSTDGPTNSFNGEAVQDVNLGQLPVGNYTLEMTIDVNNVVAESNENNNTATYEFTVGSHDFGDAPTAAQSGFASSYPTLIADGGPQHGVRAGFHLGATKDIEANGRPTASANGDDTFVSNDSGPQDDEDGITFNGALIIGSSGTFDYTLINTASAANPFLEGWIDFNRDGDWNDPGEQLISQNITGNGSITFSIPGTTPEGDSYARFRLHDGTTPLGVGGVAADGEVEDYKVRFARLGNWVDQGPAGVINGQVQNITPDRRISGATHVVVAHPTDANILYVGGVNGGIWKTTNATALNPTWTTNSDHLESLSINAMAFDPADVTHNTLVAGTGNLGSFGGLSGNLGLVYRTTDGGNTWTDPGSNGLKSFGGEAITSLATRGNVIVAASHSPGGVFRSLDAGVNYTVVNHGGVNQFDRVHDLVVDESDPTGQRLYAAVEDEGIYRSNDFGVTWTLVTGAAINAEMEALFTNTANNNIELTVHPTTGRIFAAILISGQPRGVFYSDNANTSTPSWTRMDLPILPVGGGIPVANATNANPIVITSSAAHNLSTGHFVAINGVVGNTAANGVFQVTVIDATSFSLNGVAGNGAYISGGVLTRVVTPNPSIKDVDAGSQGRIHFSIVTDPTNHDIVYIGGDRQERPSSVGDTVFGAAIFRGNVSVPRDPTAVPSPQWSHITHNIVSFDPNGGTANGTAPHADSREMVFDANGDLIETDDGGVYRRTNPRDKTGDWFSINGSLGATEMHDVAYDNISDTLFSGTQDNGTHFQTADGELTWDFFSGGDGGDVAIDDVTLAASGQSVRYSSSQNLGGFTRSTWNSAGTLVSRVGPSLTPRAGDAAMVPVFRTPFELNTIDPVRIVIQGGNATYESLDQGDSIAQVSTGFGNSSIFQNAVAYGGRRSGVDNEDVLWVGSGNQVAVRQTGTGNVAATSNLPSGAGEIRDLAIDPDDWGTAFVIDSNQVFTTTNVGAAWSDITGDLMTFAESLRSVVYIASDLVDAVVVGTNRGVFASALTNLGDWIQVGAGLPNAIVYDMDYDATDDVLISGTMGRGAWKLDAAASFIVSIFVGPTLPTITAGALTKIYDGAAFSTTVSADDGPGRRLPDADPSHFSFTYYAGPGLTGGVIAAPSDVGSYSVDVSYSGTAEYQPVASTAFDFTISPKTLSATGIAQSRVYDATTDATIDIVLSGVVSGEVVVGAATGSFSDKNVGTAKPITVSPVTLSGTDAGNYTVGAVAPTTGDITPFVLSATGTAANKVYDATNVAAVTVIVTGALGTDIVTATATGTFDNKNVGVGKTVSINSFTFGGADAGNYTAVATSTTMADITVATLTATTSAQNKSYDGTVNANVSVVLGGVLAADDVSATAPGTFENKNIGVGKTVAIGAVTLAGVDATNYVLGTVTGLTTTANIVAAQLTATGTAANKIYDGTTAATITISLAGVAVGEVVNGAAIGMFDTKNIGVGKTVTIGPVTLSGPDAGNYTVGPVAATTADISPIVLTATGAAANKVYDASVTAAVSVTLVGVLGGEIVTASASGTFDDKNVGIGKTVTIDSVALKGPAAGNYTVATISTTTANITPAALTASGAAANKVYDGNDEASITVTLGGVIGGDTVTGAASGTFNNKNIGFGKIVTIGPVTLAGVDAGNYTVGLVPITSANITAALLTANGSAADKAYDGNTAATVSISLAGVIAGENVTGTASGAFDNKNVGLDKIVNIGTVSLAGPDAANYIVGPAGNTTADITPKLLNATGTAANKVYDTTNAATITVSLAGVVASEIVTASANGRFSDKNVGVDKTVTIGSVTLAGPAASNYIVAAAPATSATITPASLTSSGTAQNKVYDGSDVANITISVLGILGADIVSGTASGRFDNKNVGTGKPVEISEVTLVGADAINYIVSPAGFSTANITPAFLGTNVSAADKVYDGTHTAAVTVALVGVFGSDTVTAAASGTFNSKNVGVDRFVTVGTITLAGADAANYRVGAAGVAFADITPVTLNFVSSAVNKVYDGSTSASVSVALIGVIGNEVVTGTASGTFVDKNVGNNKTITLSSVMLAGADAGNYVVGPSGTTTANITARQVEVTALAANKVYDGTDSATIALTVSGTIGNEVVTALAAGVFADKNVGSSKLVTIGAVTLSGPEAANYTVGPVGSTTADVTPAPLAASGTAANKTYDGSTTAVIQISLSGVIAGDAVTASAPGAFSNKNVGVAKPVSVGAVTLGGADAINYTVGTAAPTSANISVASLTATAKAFDKIYDGTDVASITIVLGGLFGTDSVTASASGAFDDKNAGFDKPVTVGAISLAGPDAANYIVDSAAPTTADIIPISLVVAATAVDKVYDGTDLATVTVTLDGLIGGEVMTATVLGKFDNKNVGVDKQVTIGAVTLTGAESGNYTAGSVAPTTATITPAVLTPTATAANKVYDGSIDVSVTITLAGVVGNDAVTASAPATFNNKDVGVAKPITIGQVLLDGANATNYTVGSVGTSSADIMPAVLSATATAATKTYDGTTDATITVTLDGVIAGDIVTATAQGAFDNKNVGSGKLVTAGLVSLGGTAAGNYTVAPVGPTTGEITRAALTPDAVAIGKVYDGRSTATVALSLSGVFGSDDIAATATGIFDNKNVGVGKPVTVTAVTLSGTDANNYTVGTVGQATGEITPAVLTATGTAASKVYDGTSSATISVSIEGVVSGDSVTAFAAGTFDDKDVGIGKTVTIGPVVLQGADAGNYIASSAGTATAAISRALLIASGRAANKVYDATDAATVTVSLSGVFGDDVVAATAQGVFDNKNVGSLKPVTIGTVALTGADSANYDVGAAGSATANVTPASLTATGTAADKVYDATSIAAISVSLVGVLPGDTVTAAAPGTFANPNVGVDKSVAIGAVTLSGTDAPNYVVGSAGTSSADITPAVLTVSGFVAEREYDGTTVATVLVSLEGVIGDDVVTGTATGTFDNKDAGTNKSVTLNSFAIAGPDAGNYTGVAATDITATINPSVVAVVAHPASKMQGQPDPAFTFEASWIVPGETAEEVLDGELTREPGEAPGEYAILQGTLDSIDGNYEIEFGSQPLTIIADESSEPVVVVSPTGPNQTPDPADLPSSPQPTSWIRQRSSLREITISLTQPRTSVSADSLVLTNLGIDADNDPDVVIPLRDDQLSLSTDGRTLLITLDAKQLPDGVYRLDLSPTLSGGASFSIIGDATNRFFVLTGDWNGSGSVNSADFATFAYWLGQDLPVAPDYVDTNDSGAITSGDFSGFASGFGRNIVFPTASAPLTGGSAEGEIESHLSVQSLVNPHDVNGDTLVTAGDALAVLYEMSNGNTPVDSGSRLDVNQDGNVTAADALQIINSMLLQSLSDVIDPTTDNSDDKVESTLQAVNESGLLNSSWAQDLEVGLAITQRGDMWDSASVPSAEVDADDVDKLLADDSFVESLLSQK